MVYNVTTFIEDKKIESKDLKIQNKIVYEVLNRYIRNNKIEMEKNNDEKVWNS